MSEKNINKYDLEWDGDWAFQWPCPGDDLTSLTFHPVIHRVTKEKYILCALVEEHMDPRKERWIVVGIASVQYVADTIIALGCWLKGGTILPPNKLTADLQAMQIIDQLRRKMCDG